MTLVIIGTVVLFIGIALYVVFDLIGKRPTRPGVIKAPGFNLSVGSDTLILCGLGVVLILAGNAGRNDSSTESAGTPTPEPSTTTAPATTTTTASTVTPEECLRRINATAREADVAISDIELGPNCTISKVSFAVSRSEDVAVAAGIAADFGADQEDVTITVEGPEPQVLINVRPVRFGVAEDALTTEAETSLDDVARYLEENPANDLAIHGHADNTGSAVANLELSRRRAEAARRYLIEERGVDADRVSAIGFGEAVPVAPNSTPEGREANRRVEFVAGQATVYVVLPGDNLWSIAANYYGDGSRWPELFEANRDRVPGPDTLLVGTELLVPPSR